MRPPDRRMALSLEAPVTPGTIVMPPFTTEQRRAALVDPGNETNEAFLVEQAAVIGPDNLRKLMRTWAACTDPDADDRGYVQACDREHLEISRVMDLYDVRGLLTVPHGQALKAANVAGIMEKTDVDGCLVGGASLDADEFGGICRFYDMPVI